jgi:hypothetical protein
VVARQVVGQAGRVEARLVVAQEAVEAEQEGVEVAQVLDRQHKLHQLRRQIQGK